MGQMEFTKKDDKLNMGNSKIGFGLLLSPADGETYFVNYRQKTA